jgi:hypothetical protein
MRWAARTGRASYYRLARVTPVSKARVHGYRLLRVRMDHVAELNDVVTVFAKNTLQAMPP